jgi:hypothetical protein
MATTHVRQGSAQRLADELQDFARDREAQGKHQRAIAAREAAERLLAGEAEVTFERVAYRALDLCADRRSEITGPYGELLATIKGAALGFDHLGKEALALDAVRAYREIQEGAEVARVGHLVFRVVSHSE